MGQQPMIAKIDADHPEEINACDKKCDASQLKNHGTRKYQQRKQVEPRPSRITAAQSISRAQVASSSL